MQRPTLLLASVFAIASPALAQHASEPSRLTMRSGTIDLAVPESPAFAALGLTPQEVTRPSSGRELAATLLNGVDREGHFQSGISIDTAPYMLWAGSRVTLEDYQAKGHYMTRFLARLQTSLATAKGASSDDESTRLALGARFTIFDRGDPRMDGILLKCLADRAAEMLDDMDNWPPVPPTADLEAENLKREEAIRNAVKPCRAASVQRRWNRSAWIAGVAPTWTSPDGKAANTAYSGTAVWTSIGYGFEGVAGLQDRALIAAYFKTRGREIVPDRFHDGNTMEQDNVTVGGRLLYGSPNSQFNGEALWVRNTRMDGVDDRYWRVGVGFEHRLVDHTWLDVSFGRELNRKPDDTYYVLGSFKWGLGERR